MRILIVEDSMLYRKAIVKYLKVHLTEAEFILAKDGKEGYEVYQKENPDIIIFDLLMPRMTGQELLTKIREIDQEIKAVVISADVQKIVKKEMEDLEIIDFINKPFNEAKAEKLAELLKEQNYA